MSLAQDRAVLGPASVERCARSRGAGVTPFAEKKREKGGEGPSNKALGPKQTKAMMLCR